MYGTYTQKAEVLIFLILVLIAFLAPYPYWLHWTFLAFIALMIHIVGNIIIYY